MRGYRIDILAMKDGKPEVPKRWIMYTSRNDTVTLEFAEALGRGLERQSQPFRICEVTGKEKEPHEYIRIVYRFRA